MAKEESKGPSNKSKDAKEKSKDEKAPQPPKPVTPLELLQQHIVLIEKYVDSKDSRFLTRALRHVNHLRGNLSNNELENVIETFVLDEKRKAVVLDIFSTVATKRRVASLVDEMSLITAAASTANASSFTPEAPKAPPKPSIASAPEVDLYLTSFLLAEAAQQSAWSEVARFAAGAVEYALSQNRRTLFFFASRALSWLSLAHERLGSSASIRPQLVAAHRTACLRSDDYGQAVALNLLLRNYIAADEYDLASKLALKATFPESASAAQYVRYLYYRGRIHAVQLDYSDAHGSLLQAVRKAPATAVGFRIAATKLACVVQLLMGEIPDRATFNAPDTANALRPYLAIAAAVRLGDLRIFGDAVRTHAAAFLRDRTLTLIRRLDANVIKTGLHKLAASYSRISFCDIAAKLHLDAPEDAEFLCAKAIRDGVIDAVLDNAAGTMSSRDAGNVYLTKEPQEAFHRRITFCLDVHNEAVKGMRYPPGAHRKDLESEEARREREKDEAALVQDIEDGKMDDDDDESGD